MLLTPAVLAIIRRSKIPPMPCLFACAFVANAASFVLPISNPANLVVFKTIPTITPWLSAFALASLVAISGTYVILRFVFRRDLRATFCENAPEPVPGLDRAGRSALVAVAASAVVVAVAASLGSPIGITAFLVAAISVLIVAGIDPNTPRLVISRTPWSIVPLVSGLFVIVQALDLTGALDMARNFFRYAGAMPRIPGNLLTGFTVMVAGNILNNLPVGVLARFSLQNHGIDAHLTAPVLVGVDVGPNLSLTGSLATLLWLMMLRRENIEISMYGFLRIGALVTLPTLAAALLVVR